MCMGAGGMGMGIGMGMGEYGPMCACVHAWAARVYTAKPTSLLVCGVHALSCGCICPCVPMRCRCTYVRARTDGFADDDSRPPPPAGQHVAAERETVLYIRRNYAINPLY